MSDGMLIFIGFIVGGLAGLVMRIIDDIRNADESFDEYGNRRL